jgi:ferrous-iron efflux pump FieF
VIGTAPAADRDRLMRHATTASVSVASLLAFVKLTAWLVTGSVAILSSMLDSVMDVCASLILFVTIRHAVRPADHSHRFGHGKAEPLGAAAQAAFIAGSALLLIVQSAGRFVTPVPVAETPIGIAAMVFAIVATGALILFQGMVIRRTASTAVEADRLHFGGDILGSLAVIASLFAGAGLGWHWIDPVTATAIACYLLFSAWRIGHRAVDLLMDRELPPEERTRIAAIVGADADVHGLHDLRTRMSGSTRFVELHLELDGTMGLTAVHAVCDRVEAALCREFPAAEISLHPEPAGIEDERLDARLH